MNCSAVEERLSEYLERSLLAEETRAIAQHLQTCRGCSALLDQMRSIVGACNSFPVLEFEGEMTDRILMRTSGRPRRRRLKELFLEYFARPIFTPRFAIGAALALLFLGFVTNRIGPQIVTLSSALTPGALLARMDRGAQQIYSEGLRAYDKKNELQAEFLFVKNNIVNKLGLIMERLEIPVEGKQSPEPRPEPGNAPKKPGATDQGSGTERRSLA